MWIAQFNTRMGDHTSSRKGNITNSTMKLSQLRTETLVTQEMPGFGGLVALKPKVLCYFQTQKSEKKICKQDVCS